MKPFGFRADINGLRGLAALLLAGAEALPPFDLEAQARQAAWALGVASNHFSAGQWLLRGSALQDGFFLLPARAWELLAGGLAFLWSSPADQTPSRVRRRSAACRVRGLGRAAAVPGRALRQLPHRGAGHGGVDGGPRRRTARAGARRFACAAPLALVRPAQPGVGGFLAASECPPVPRFERQQPGYDCQGYAQRVWQLARQPAYDTVVVIDSVPEAHTPVAHRLERERFWFGQPRLSIDARTVAADNAWIDPLLTGLRDTQPRFFLESLRGVLCNAARCRVHDDTLQRPIYTDESHFDPVWIAENAGFLAPHVQAGVPAAARQP